ncbi:hypothetical protein BBD42_30850 [Paenibacillus sp. BIHB 4019]|uniref:Uncharacterized protein n=1 Tax=Paenibacillus sp. BIHB 4019 TaxID=1870819 RepID=A0A1B2DRS2_9BACL|nr:hypothetical protein [Paenibacillus sp. BIHB 4019]ANY70406.1 hypothetical protein BBD42_30850 [Paenibacillus sp. BIHB 4019]
MAFIPRIIEKFLDMANLKKHNDNYADIKTELDANDVKAATAQADINSHKSNTSNPHAVTAAQVGAETPAGAQAKATAVQTNLNTHANNNAIHTTQTEKDKLAGIQALAEVNQFAFSKVAVAGQSDVDADTKTDTLNIAGGTGITITTNPVTDTLTFTATGTATPGAHASSHITGGADVIPDAVSGGNSGLMPGADRAAMAGATSAATPSTFVKRDAANRFKVAAPAAADDVANKTYVDNLPAISMARQAIINGNFDVWQRGTSFANPSNGLYTADRYQVSSGSDGGTFPAITHLRAETAGLVADSFYFYRMIFGGAGASLGNLSYYWLRQKIDQGTRYLCGASKKVTVSFWARSDIPGKKIGLHIQQYYGSGGTPSALETINGTNWTLTANWNKYSLTLDTNTLVGKTFGTNNDDYLIVNLMYQWGSGYAARAGASAAEGFGAAGNVDVTQIQVCSGDAALPFQPKSFVDELALCQRYYEKSYSVSAVPGSATLIGMVMGGNGLSTTDVRGTSFKVSKRTAPTVTLYSQTGNVSRMTANGGTDTANAVASYVGTEGFLIVSSTGLSTAGYYYYHYIADAEL